MENGIEVKELNQAERYGARLNTCMDAYNDKVKEVSIITVQAATIFSNIYKNSKVMGKLSDRETELVMTTVNVYKDNREYYKSLDVKVTPLNGPLTDYIHDYEIKISDLTKSISGVLAEIWLLVSIFDEIDEETNEFLSIAYAGTEYGALKNALDGIDHDNVKVIKQVYNSDPKLALNMLRDMMNEVHNRAIIEDTVAEDIKDIDEEVVEDVLTFMEVIEDDDDDEVESKTSKSSSSSSSTDYSTITKVGIGIVGLLAVGYVGKKIYDHFNSDDVVIIDSDGLDFNSSFSNVCDGFTDSFKNNW